MRRRKTNIGQRIEEDGQRRGQTSPASLPAKSVKAWQLADDVPAVGAVAVQDEGVAKGNATTLDFVGASVTVTFAGGKATVTITGGGGGDVATDAIWDALGDLLYGTGADTGVKLAGNITAIKKFLRQTGTGAASAAPAWEVIPLFDAVATQTLISTDDIHVTDGSPLTQISSASAITLTSTPTIAAGRNGQVAYLHNVGAYNITLQDISVIPSNVRLTNSTVAIPPGGTMETVYDSTLGAWIQVTTPLTINPFNPAIATFTVDNFSLVTHEVATGNVVEAPTTHLYDFTYVGVPSACTVDIDGGKIGGDTWPVVVTTPFLTKTGANNFYRATSVLGTRILTATATVSGQVKTKTVTITYMNNRFLGSNVKNPTQALTEAEIEALATKELSNSKVLNGISVTGTNYIWFAYPSRLSPSLYFAIGVDVSNAERTGFTDRGAAVTVTNPSGYAETYQQFCSNVSGMGAVTLFSNGSQLFNNRKYWGPHTDSGSITSAHILTLDDVPGKGGSDVVNAYTGQFTIVVAGNEYVWLAYPSRITGTPVFKDHATGFPVAMDNRGTVSHTNDRGYTETYQTWQSTNKLNTTLVMDVT